MKYQFLKLYLAIILFLGLPLIALGAITSVTQGGTGVGSFQVKNIILSSPTTSTSSLISLAPGSNGQCLTASSTATSGYAWSTCGTGGGSSATTTILTNVTTNGPNFTFSSGTPDTNLGLIMSGSGSTVTFQPAWTGFLAVSRGGTGTNTLASLTVGSNLSISGGQNVIIGTSTSISLGTSVVTSIATGTTGTIFNASIGSNTLTLNLPFASGSNTGQLQSTDWTTFNNKVGLSYASSSYFTLWNTVPGLNITITTSSNPTIATVASPTFTNGIFTGTLNVTGTSTLATTTLPQLTISGLSNGCLQSVSGLISTTSCGGGGSLAGGTKGFVAIWASSTALTVGTLLDNGTVAGQNATSSLISFNIQSSPGLTPLVVSSSTGVALLTVAGNGSTTLSSLATAGNVQSTSGGSLYVNGQTGTGLNVLQNSPTLVTPILGVASGTALSLSGNLFVTGTSTLATVTTPTLLVTGLSNCTNIQSAVSGLLSCNNTSYQPLITFPITYASSTATTTNVIYTDINRADTYTANGSIVYPYKTITAMLGASAWGSGNVFNLAPGTYVDGSPDTFPSTPFYLSGNEATYVPSSGVTLPGSFDIYDLTIGGNVVESGSSLSTMHQFNNGVITGNLSTAGLATLSGMALTGTTSVFTALPGSLNNFVGSLSYAKFVNQGTMNINDDQIQASTTGYSIYSTTTGSQLNILGLTDIQTGNGGGINANNGATSSPNFLTALSIVSNTTTPAGGINLGNAATQLCDYYASNLSGTILYAQGTNLLPCIDGSLTVQATTTLQGTLSVTGTSTLATTTVANLTDTGALTVSGSSSLATTTIAGPLTTTGSNAVTLGVLATSFPGCVQTSGSGVLSNTNTACGASLSGGTNGKVARWTSASAISTGILLDNGTVSGVNATSSTVSFLVQGTGTNIPFQVASSSTVAVFTIASNNDIGIGTTTPQNLLTLQGSSGTSTNLFTVASSSGASMLNESSNGLLTIQPTATSSALTILNPSGQVTFAVDQTATLPGLNVNAPTSTQISTLYVLGTTASSTAPLFILASSTATALVEVDASGHQWTGGTAPTCGTGCSSVTGDDGTMRVVTGSSVTAVTVNFASTWVNPKTGVSISPSCVGSDESGGTTTSDPSSTPTSLTINLSASLTSKNLTIQCRGSTNFTN